MATGLLDPAALGLAPHLRDELPLRALGARQDPRQDRADLVSHAMALDDSSDEGRAVDDDVEEDEARDHAGGDPEG
ncbi:hypothetical protein [Nocardioides pinisoli]|uniref:Uncharacterized protein n=1 Tax=Nocardioides pinisoli TaxID=2950279 RepID=A0ABT1KSZ4_9ACTN|nr:hypothetical protein [Nocardioides pinisoli]MCP3420777.1 hypothetical protein [Nocardioides pinisoli]